MRSRFQHDVHAEHRNQREREHRGIARLTEDEVHRCGDDEHHCHRIEKKPNEGAHSGESVPAHPAIWTDHYQAPARLDGRQPVKLLRDVELVAVHGHGTGARRPLHATCQSSWQARAHLYGIVSQRQRCVFMSRWYADDRSGYRRSDTPHAMPR
jgi:hypothetical protein